MADLTRELETLSGGLEGALAGDLVSLLLYGSAARDAHVEGRSDVNLLLVVRDASPASLRRASAPLASWAGAGRRPPLIMSEAEWQAAADVFPMEMEDIREAHRLLAGRDPTEGVVVHAADIRRELERETRGVVSRLRALYAAVGSEGPSLEELLVNSLGTVLVLFRAAVRLSGKTPPREAAALVREAAAQCGMYAAAFDWALAARAGKPPRALAAFDDVATGYLQELERFAGWVDEHKSG